MQQGNKEASKIERNKIKQLRRSHGIYPFFSLINIFQIPIHIVYMSLINRMSQDFFQNPAILTDGILWFKDLSAPDPTGILPIIGGFISLLNVMSSSAAVQNQMFRNFSKFMRLMPFISIPIWMTFPAAFNIYWIVNSGFQLALVSVVRSERFRKYLGIP